MLVNCCLVHLERVKMPLCNFKLQDSEDIVLIDSQQQLRIWVDKENMPTPFLKRLAESEEVLCESKWWGSMLVERVLFQIQLAVVSCAAALRIRCFCFKIHVVLIRNAVALCSHLHNSISQQHKKHLVVDRIQWHRVMWHNANVWWILTLCHITQF